MPFLSTLSLRRATAAEHRLLALNSISIHALLAESDKPDKKAGSQEKDFYPRSPCGERPFFYSLTACRQYFYPRSPCGERRAPTAQPVHPHSHFYPRSPCGERPSCFSLWFLGLFISIHALLAESDSLYMDSVPPASRFLSTLSLRRATRLFLEIYTLFKNFYPRSPCGERRVVHVAQDPSPGRISIHALLAESDPAGNGGSGSITAISIHALLAESDTKDKKYKIKKAIFLSTLSLRRATSA